MSQSGIIKKQEGFAFYGFVAENFSVLSVTEKIRNLSWLITPIKLYVNDIPKCYFVELCGILLGK